jgi:hypothetical protein
LGLALTAGTLAAVLSQIPAGALVDALRWKRALAASGTMDGHEGILQGHNPTSRLAPKCGYDRFDFSVAANWHCDRLDVERSAAASNKGRKINPPPGAVSGLNIMATRLTLGAMSVSNSRHLPANEISRLMKPVRFPPGRGRLATNPAPIGSATVTNTIGIVCALNAAGGPANVVPHIAAIGPTQLRKPARQLGRVGLGSMIVFIELDEHADPPHWFGLLRARR